MNSNPVRKEIVEKADIVNIISQYVKLEKRGNNYIGLCPFHEDKNPSMSVFSVIACCAHTSTHAQHPQHFVLSVMLMSPPATR